MTRDHPALGMLGSHVEELYSRHVSQVSRSCSVSGSSIRATCRHEPRDDVLSCWCKLPRCTQEPRILSISHLVRSHWNFHHEKVVCPPVDEIVKCSRICAHEHPNCTKQNGQNLLLQNTSDMRCKKPYGSAYWKMFLDPNIPVAWKWITDVCFYSRWIVNFLRHSLWYF